MTDDIKRLSDYIDMLNEEKKPKEHGGAAETAEMAELFATVRLVRGLREPSLPQGNFAKELSSKLNERQTQSRSRNWWLGVASVAAVLAVFLLANMVIPLGKNDIVYAMEQAFKEVEAYHGVLQISETNATGTVTTQAELEVWADKQGKYYVKTTTGAQKDLLTINDGQKKWQLQPQLKQVKLFPAFPDPYSFTFELGEEIKAVQKALKTEVIGEARVAGRPAMVVEVTPKGGKPYKIWIDKETKLPLQKQFAMQNALQYKVAYTKIEYSEAIPQELLAYKVPQGYKESKQNHEQLVSNLEEAADMVGFTVRVPRQLPSTFSQTSIAVGQDVKVVKLYYTSADNTKQLVVSQTQTNDKFKVASMAILGKVNGSILEIQAPMQAELGILGGGVYAGATDINSMRWQQGKIEYAVVGNLTVGELVNWVKSLTNGEVQLPAATEVTSKPQIEVPVDMEVEKGDQQNADAGHSPWKLDPAFVAQVFVSLQISPGGIQGEYPIAMEDLKVVKNTGTEVVVKVADNKATINRVYLKRLVRQDATGVWTVVGYDVAQ